MTRGPRKGQLCGKLDGSEELVGQVEEGHGGRRGEAVGSLLDAAQQPAVLLVLLDGEEEQVLDALDQLQDGVHGTHTSQQVRNLWQIVFVTQNGIK